jgi:predicted P-loop ATPase/GTPase
MSAQEGTIVDYIKSHYPKVVFKPFKFAFHNAVGFVITGGKLIVGFINADGTLCKLADPIDLENGNVGQLVNKLPIVEGFTQADKDKLQKMFGAGQVDSSSISKEHHDEIVASLKSQLSHGEEQYKLLLDSTNKQVLAVKNEDMEKVGKIQQEFEQLQKKLDECTAQLVQSQSEVKDGIAKYKDEMQTYIKSKDLKIEELQNVYNKLAEEKAQLQGHLDGLLKRSEQQLAVAKENEDAQHLIQQKEEGVETLKNTIKSLNGELEMLKDELSKSKMKEMTIRGHVDKCSEKLLKEKEVVIEKIKDYHNKWMGWATKVRDNFSEHKKALIAVNRQLEGELQKLKDGVVGNNVVLSTKQVEIQQLEQQIEDIKREREKAESLYKDAGSEVIQIKQDKGIIEEQKQQLESKLQELNLQKEKIDNENTQLKQNIKDIESQLRKIISDQLITLNSREEQVKILESAAAKSEVALQEKDIAIADLKKQLNYVNTLLAENRNAKVSMPIESVDYDTCLSTVQNFFILNNTFYRKQEIIRTLDNIFENNLGAISNLPEETADSIRKRYADVKSSILAHIKFLDLDKYVKSENFQLLKSKTTREKVPPLFCEELNNILSYWNDNREKYYAQDTQLTNIYEDLSGAVRVYVRVKPLIGVEQNGKSVNVAEVAGKRAKSVELKCGNIRQNYGQYFGVFDDTFSNVDVYTGLQDTPNNINERGSAIVNTDEIISEMDSISPGLYNAFKQVEDGYNLVLFGYGLSGSGKTFSLLGGNGAPGLLHYALANLHNAKQIKLKNVFEQYVSIVNLNFGKISGNIHNLVKEVPQISQNTYLAKDEREQFARVLPSEIDVNNIKVSDLDKLTAAIDSYRISQKRIKPTPNNPMSSRSHLFMVFEISFGTNNTGYITIVDTAGRESPVDIFNMYIDSSKTSLASVMTPSLGEKLISQYKRNPEDDTKTILSILKEGFYINETINHMIYFFQKKNFKTPKVNLLKPDLEKYDVSGVFIDPRAEEKSINSANACLTIPVLKYLDNITKAKLTDYKPTKFIMMCNVRQEERYCEQTMATLKFAESIAST